MHEVPVSYLPSGSQFAMSEVNKHTKAIERVELDLGEREKKQKKRTNKRREERRGEKTMKKRESFQVNLLCCIEEERESWSLV